LTDLNFGECLDAFLRRGKIACFLSVPAPDTFHIVHADADNFVSSLEHVGPSLVRINAGFMILRREIFDYMNTGEEFVVEPFQRLIEKREPLAVPYDGFWQNMDTFKDKIQFDHIVERGKGPWEVWKP
jgi:glucose-1-phosphate cytidylyltransferase